MNNSIYITNLVTAELQKKYKVSQAGYNFNRHICELKYFSHYLPFAIIVPVLCVLISKVLDKFNKNISFCFSFVGSLSLEIYLLHVLLLNYWKKYLFDLTISYTTMSFIFFFILVLLCSYLLSFIINPLSKYIKQYAQ